MIGSTLAAWLSAAAPMVSWATLRAWAHFGASYLLPNDAFVVDLNKLKVV